MSKHIAVNLSQNKMKMFEGLAFLLVLHIFRSLRQPTNASVFSFPSVSLKFIRLQIKIRNHSDLTSVSIAKYPHII